MRYSVQFPTPKTSYSGVLKLKDVRINFAEDNDTAAHVIESLSTILHCKPDQIGRGGREGQPITIDVTRTVLECAMWVAGSVAAESARRREPPTAGAAPEVEAVAP